MIKMSKEELNAHLKENLGKLSEVVRYEAAERATIKENLAEFHNAVDEHAKTLNANAEERRTKNLSELDAQIAELNKLIAQS